MKSTKTKILFVCHGNICRSPMAEYLLKQLVRDDGREDAFEIASAATSTNDLGCPVYPPARRELAKHGIHCDGHLSRLMCREDYDYYDLLIGMDEYNIRNMLHICGGDPQGKICRLLDFTKHPHNIPDPWFTGDFAATWHDCLAGCKALLKIIK